MVRSSQGVKGVVPISHGRICSFPWYDAKSVKSAPLESPPPQRTSSPPLQPGGAPYHLQPPFHIIEESKACATRSSITTTIERELNWSQLVIKASKVEGDEVDDWAKIQEVWDRPTPRVCQSKRGRRVRRRTERTHLFPWHNAHIIPVLVTTDEQTDLPSLDGIKSRGWILSTFPSKAIEKSFGEG
ncbi:BZ3500_MvSof-1268-A1-R1_Chr9g10446 [Microbotryum saponariae]|uniref:BZ3500_MvSof-1268-A1-R1_Chr9g10446 protein n=1 Tax=Microbotryum saponariae TaxID=289078 RepID=A0A2X0N4G0_9BASI|nr:BZ3501_MvSof-1269-A2-R1_Chr9g10196 [Microbotryum saponariae]SDA00106.1 BZ3500_MvSof-1268-A1-R1_Chr9g10446 [Microbotryum saponariae]